MYNDSVKEPNKQIEYNQEQVNELLKCSEDFNSFAKHLKIITKDGEDYFNLWPFQKEMIDIFTNNRFSIILAGRQQGKCVSKNTKIKIKNKISGKIKKISIKNLYDKTT